MRYFLNTANNCKYKTKDKFYIELFSRVYTEIEKEEFNQIEGAF